MIERLSNQLWLLDKTTHNDDENYLDDLKKYYCSIFDSYIFPKKTDITKDSEKKDLKKNAFCTNDATRHSHFPKKKRCTSLH